MRVFNLTEFTMFHFRSVRLKLINHLVGFIPCQFACNSTLSNPVKIVQRNKVSQLDLTGESRLASRQMFAHMPSMPEAEESRQLSHYRTKVLGWPSSYLAT